ncbi:MAG: PQQ-binding-like beta-propeller repeat protein [Beijerinckiaceae bacterium]|nr:PQQ-binding-like beta-propeller repeat protein [Beijerinckiaceae bacterium]
MRALYKKFLVPGFAAIVAAGMGWNASADSLSVGNSDPNNWPEYHRTWNAWRYSPLEQINKTNVKKLKVAWIHQAGDITNGLLSTPLVEDGIMYYVAPNNNVFALDAVTGTQIWHYQPKLNPIANQSFYAYQSRNITLGKTFVYLGTLDGRVVAVDKKTGSEVWSTQLTDLKKCYGCLFSSTPVLAGNVLVGGTTGGDQPIAGKIFGVDATTGKLLWTFNTTKDDPKSWPGDTGKVGGATAWNVGTYDPTTDSVYIGVGNAAPDFFNNERHGDNLYAASLLALDPKNGTVKWARQEIPNDHYDYDAAYEALVLDQAGKQVITHLSKSGFVFVMDKSSGALTNVWPMSKTFNFVKSIDPHTGALIGQVGDYAFDKETTICPYLLGTRSWNPGAYNPKTKLWYNNAMEVCEVIKPAKQDVSKIGIAGLYLGVDKLEAVSPPNEPASARLEARDPLTGKLAWSVPYKLPGLGGVLTTGGDLVFNGDPQGLVHAYDAGNGKELWSFQTGSGIRAGIISYAVNGKQYIAVPSGYGSLAPGFMASVFPEVTKIPGGATMIVFALE